MARTAPRGMLPRWGGDGAEGGCVVADLGEALLELGPWPLPHIVLAGSTLHRGTADTC
jgi:hypothetical protein